MRLLKIFEEIRMTEKIRIVIGNIEKVSRQNSQQIKQMRTDGKQ